MENDKYLLTPRPENPTWCIKKVTEPCLKTSSPRPVLFRIVNKKRRMFFATFSIRGNEKQ
ncbi:hypothetical protein E2C01_043103 [Portunus trituberculatus]|uniref:Uncharacterized protein n=1 Tax=Portunus trituberculatus TaxID=210409 RepID=A0A5B7FVE3_PORTR|nr:hypothetical protein [Portunus trituberculatus]